MGFGLVWFGFLTMCGKSLALAVQLGFLLTLGGKIPDLGPSVSRVHFTDAGSFWGGLQVPFHTPPVRLHPHSSVTAPWWWRP